MERRSVHGASMRSILPCFAPVYPTHVCVSRGRGSLLRWYNFGVFRIQPISRLTLLAAAALVIVALSALACEGAAGRAESHFEAGIELESQGRIEEAIEQYSQALEINPADADFYFRRGGSYGRLGQYDRALEDLDQAVRLDSGHVGAYSTRGITYFLLGEYLKALDDHNQAIERFPQIGEFYVNRAKAYTRLGDDGAAQLDVERAIELGFDEDELLAEIEKQKSLR